MEQSDRSKFDYALSKLLYATNGTARPSPTIIKTYWSVLESYPWSDVAKGMTDAVNKATGHVSPATLANFCRPAPPDVMHAATENRVHELERRMSQADARSEAVGEVRFGDLWFDAEFRDVLRVANMEYGRKCSGQIPGGVRIPTAINHGYHGAFDYAAVVAQMSKPAARISPDESGAAWDCFWAVLREEFEKYQDAL